jgi:hypothetical protein
VKRTLVLALIGLLTLGTSVPLVVDAQVTPAITITRPAADGETIAEGDDFATTVLGDPWDMSETFPVPAGVLNAPPDVESTINVDNVSIQNGTWRGTARNGDPQLYLLTRGYGQNDPCCVGSIHWKNNDGYVHPIDADTYHFVSVRMKLTGANPTNEGQFLWYRDDNPFTPPETSHGFRTVDGWQTYTFDLKTLGTVSGSWSGTIKGFRFDPATTQGVQIEIDSFRLLTDVPERTKHTVQWQTTNAPTGALVDLYCNDVLGQACTIGENIPATLGSQIWSVNFLNPGSYTISARMGTDYAALTLNDPWDLTAPTDAALNQLSGNFNQPISNGLTGFSGTSTGDDPQFLLSVPAPLDTAIYKILTVNIRVNTPDAIARQVQVFWLANGAWNPGPLATVGTDMEQLSFDLSQFPNWTGQITGLRIDPAARLAGGARPVPVELGPVTLTTAGSDQHVYTSVSGPLTVNTAPQIQITAPSTSSGPDFATSVLGDAWDFNNAEDVQKVEFSPFQIRDGAISGVSVQSMGPDFELNTRHHQINTTKYHYLTYTMRLDDSMHTAVQQARDHALKIAEGWAARVLWWGPAGPPHDHCTSAWAVVEPYEYTYTIDLATAPIETGTSGGQIACGPQGKPWKDATNVTEFRFDPHEVPQPTGWSVSDIKLTGIQEGTSSLTIQWGVTEPNSGQPITVKLGYRPANTSGAPTPIATVSDGSTSYTWDTSSIPRGVYDIVATIDDGLNAIQRSSSAPFTTSPVASPCEPRPNVSVQSAPSGDGRLKVTVTASSPGNPLQAIAFGQTNNALIDISGGRTGSTGGFAQALTPGTLSYSFFLRRATAGQAATAPFTVTDGCGEWKSFAGGGTAAPF